MVDDAENLGRVVEATRPDRIVVALAERRGRLPLYQLLESRARGILVEDAVETYERLTSKLALEALSPSSVIFSREFQTSRLQLVLSRVLSLLAAVVGVVALAPVLVLIGLLIRLDSRGSVFFIQERVGRFGKRFKLVKFRTMHPVGRPKSEWERDNGDRITRVGQWLRRYRLDERPHSFAHGRYQAGRRETPQSLAGRPDRDPKDRRGICRRRGRHMQPPEAPECLAGVQGSALSSDSTTCDCSASQAWREPYASRCSGLR